MQRTKTRLQQLEESVCSIMMPPPEKVPRSLLYGTIWPRLETKAFYNRALKCVEMLNKQAIPGLKTRDFDRTGYLKELLQKQILDEPMSLIELDLLDISVDVLKKVHKNPKIKLPLPDLIKYGMGIMWSEIPSKQEALDAFWHVYLKQSHTAKSWNSLKSSHVEHAIDKKVSNYWKNQRSLLFNSKTDDDCASSKKMFKQLYVPEIYFEKCKKAFKEFSKLNYLNEGFTFHFAVKQFLSQQALHEVDQYRHVFAEHHNSLRKSFNARKLRATFSKPHFSAEDNDSVPIVHKVDINDEITLGYKKDGAKIAFLVVQESKDFEKWQRDNVVCKIENTEADYDSTKENLIDAKEALLCDLDSAVEFTVKRDPLILVRNFSVDMFEMPPVRNEMYTPNQCFALHQEHDGAYGYRCSCVI